MNITKHIVIKSETKNGIDELKKLLHLAAKQAEQLEDTLNQLDNMEIIFDFEVNDEIHSAEIHAGTIKTSSIHSARLLQ